MSTTRNSRRTIEGTVTSDKCAKTITVQVERTYRHPKYKKYVRKMARYHAHDEKSEAKPGDRVEIRFCRPLSKTKRWALVRIIDRSKVGEAVDVTSGIVEGGGGS
jgi:small subunit ribosomal protein S17